MAVETQQEISEIKGEIEGIEELEKDLDEEKLEKQELKTFLSGEYDKNNALLEIYAGAGGQDSQDWATMILRMYQRYCEKKGFKTAIIHQTFGEGGGPEGRIGTKSVMMEIDGSYAYGFLKKEAGVHRLVRQSPFNAKSLRQTSFALVNVLPKIEEVGDLEIKPDDLRIETFKASGPGGQYVNKTESAVRITHIPSGQSVASQSERSQPQNKENAMKILYSRLRQLEEVKKTMKLKEMKGDYVQNSFGAQIRSYVLHPYKMVKDLRTQYETSDTEGVLDGDLEKFIESELKSND
jgi:peptide chain release factor 2